MATTHPRSVTWQKAIGIGMAVALAVGLLVAAFAWPVARSAPADIPVAVAGPPPAVAEFSAQLQQRAPGVFAAREATDADAAERLIREREVYGAFVLAPGAPPAVITASAASPVVAQLLQSAAAGPVDPAEMPASEVTDLVPLPENDPRGAGFAAAALPMVMGGLLLGVACALLLPSAGKRAAGLATGAVLSGLVMGGVTQGWLGVLAGNYWLNSAAIALTIGAIAATVAGLHAILGHAGIALGAITVFLLGNPLSGVAVPPEMLPSGWGVLGQALPPGAGVALLRSVAFFDGAAAARPVWVLTAWLIVGLALLLLGGVRTRLSRV